MGLRFRKSINMGPFRLNLSKSGVGYSVGGKGFRFTKKANGGYRTTLYLPGTGISHVEDTKKVNENNELSYPNIDPFTLKKRQKGCFTFFIILILTPFIVFSILHFQEQSYKTVEISDGDLLLLENHPLIFDEYSYAKEFYRPIKNKRVKVLDSVRYSELQKKEKNVLDDDIILYLVSDSKKQNIDSIHINLIDSNIFLNLNIDQVKNIALSYLPNNFFEIYSNDASYQFSSDGVTTYTASYRLNQNGIDYHNNVDSNISPYYYFRLIHFTATNKWQIKTGISAYGGKELEWINNYATPWNIE